MSAMSEYHFHNSVGSMVNSILLLPLLKDVHLVDCEYCLLVVLIKLFPICRAKQFANGLLLESLDLVVNPLFGLDIGIADVLVIIFILAFFS
jgi:hypothetical protein